MITVEKITCDGDTQYFEIITSRKELQEWFNDYWWNIETGDTEWLDEDTAIHWYLKDGTDGCLMDGFPLPKKPSIRNIAQYIESNSATTVIYGKGLEIVQNDHYGDWEVVEAV